MANSSPGFCTTLRRHLNFFRIHLLFFTFTPLICSVIIYASNGRYPIPYIDALYNSVSAMTVCGLGSVNLSQLTPWQQVLLFLQMCLGSPVLVAWFMVLIRRHFFAKKFEYIIQAEAAQRAVRKTQTQQSQGLTSATVRHKFGWPVPSLRRRVALSPVAEKCTNEDWSSTQKENVMHNKLRTDMIRRMDAPPERVNPSGWISEGITTPLKRLSIKIGSSGGQEKGQPVQQPSSIQIEAGTNPASGSVVEHTSLAQPEDSRVPSDATLTPGDSQPATSPLDPVDSCPPQSSSPQLSPTSVGMHRTTTIEFADIVTRRRVPLAPVLNRRSSGMREPSTDELSRREPLRSGSYSRRYPSMGGHSRVSLTRNPSHHASQQIIGHTIPEQTRASQTGFGGFPMPHKLLGTLFRRLFPRTANRLRKTLTIPATTALSGGELGRTASISGRSAAAGNIPGDSRPVPYISFDAIVGRNSAFEILNNEQLEELGGVEYRGLNALLWLVALYHIGIQLISFIVIAPYMAMPKWASDFVPPALIRPVATPWFSLFQVVSTYTNTGFSLVDQSMIPFQTAYPMIFFMVFMILAGNSAFPIFLRLMIWIIAKLIPTQSRLYETLHFLLDHPRRCFVYLFPAHQTWFLLLVLVLLNSIDFLCFMVLDIGNATVESIPLGTRFATGLLQVTDVRASGFSVVPVAALAPAVKVMFVIMMYISVYPIAMSVRSTNVYEEQSLGIFHSTDQLSEAEKVFNKMNDSRMTAWSRYLAMHARYQLSFDMWWLALALFLICIIEKDNLTNTEMQDWFNIFSIFFEIVSAYGSVGLSLGIPTQNYSLSGAFRPLSKFIICLVMIRGRHRGLPVAIDRAIVPPFEFERAVDNPDPPPAVDERRSSRYSVGSVPQPMEATDNDKYDHDHEDEDGIAVEEKERVGGNEVGSEHAS